MGVLQEVRAYPVTGGIVLWEHALKSYWVIRTPDSGKQERITRGGKAAGLFCFGFPCMNLSSPDTGEFLLVTILSFFDRV